MFIKEVLQKKATSSTTSPPIGQEKKEKIKDAPKSADGKSTNDIQGAATTKRASQPKVERIKTNAELSGNSTFDMAQALTWMKVTVPLIELLKIKEHRDVALSLFSNISDSDTFLPTGSVKNGKDQEFQTSKVYVGTTITQEPS